MYGMENIVFYGNGSSFIFHGQTMPFTIEKCRGIIVKGISIDWEIPLSAEGTVVTSGTDYICLLYTSFSVSYISKMFKAYTGIPVKEYITQKRIAMASELLLNTGKKVWEVGEAVGYDQQRSFIEIFKKYRGMTPSEYRREGKKADEAQK